MTITKLDQMFDVLKGKDKKRLIAVYANDDHTIEAVYKAVEKGLIDATLVGDKETILSVCKDLEINPDVFNIEHEADVLKAARLSCDLINQGKGDIIMKGMLSTDQYMRALLNKESGLMQARAVLSHITVVENSAYHKLMIVGDVAIIPEPELKEKIVITNNLIKTAKRLGVETPKVAMIAATEQMSYKMQACVDAAIISKMADRGQIKGAYVDGPLALDVAIDEESAKIKKLDSKVAGDADCLVFPNIESGNVFYKLNTKLCNAQLGAVVSGAKVPAVLSSRGDSVETKLYSIALGALLA